MRQFRGSLLVAALLLAASAMPAAASGATLPVGPAQTTDNLNIRSGPGLDFSIVTVIPRSATVNITGAPRNGFYPVTYLSYTGWSFGDYLVAADEDDVIPPGPAYTSDPLHLRKGPANTFAILRTIPASTKVFVLGKPRGGYYPLRYDGTRGWASADYLSEEKEDPVTFIPTTRVQRIVKRVLVANGLASEWNVVAKIVSRESSWVPTALNMDTNDHYARGLFQINDEWFASWWKRFGLRWNVAADNTRMAIRIYRASNNCWTAWGEGCGATTDGPAPRG